jgi:hypothetical protein
MWPVAGRGFLLRVVRVGPRLRRATGRRRLNGRGPALPDLYNQPDEIDAERAVKPAC